MRASDILEKIALGCVKRLYEIRILTVITDWTVNWFVNAIITTAFILTLSNLQDNSKLKRAQKKSRKFYFSRLKWNSSMYYFILLKFFS